MRARVRVHGPCWRGRRVGDARGDAGGGAVDQTVGSRPSLGEGRVATPEPQLRGRFGAVTVS